MSSEDADKSFPLIWCPVIPLEKLDELSIYEEELRKLSRFYDDWCASMRSKDFKGGDVGIYLDRIRMLMINIGVASGANREFAEEVQSIISEALRGQILKSVSEMSVESDSRKIVKETLTDFFSHLRFTRDIDPTEEIERSATASIGRSSGMLGKVRGLARGTTDDKEPSSSGFVRMALVEASRIVLRTYLRLLSPNPWDSV
ncbi:MAG: hypothetical protein RTU92_07310 [Candidatus Thorarchaeota archaeon]